MSFILVSLHCLVIQSFLQNNNFLEAPDNEEIPNSTPSHNPKSKNSPTKYQPYQGVRCGKLTKNDTKIMNWE